MFWNKQPVHNKSKILDFWKVQIKLTEILSMVPYHLYVNVHERPTPPAMLLFNWKHKCKKLSLH